MFKHKVLQQLSTLSFHTCSTTLWDQKAIITNKITPCIENTIWASIIDKFRPKFHKSRVLFSCINNKGFFPVEVLNAWVPFLPISYLILPFNQDSNPKLLAQSPSYPSCLVPSRNRMPAPPLLTHLLSFFLNFCSKKEGVKKEGFRRRIQQIISSYINKIGFILVTEV